jgi:hypothetical protein
MEPCRQLALEQQGCSSRVVAAGVHIGWGRDERVTLKLALTDLGVGLGQWLTIRDADDDKTKAKKRKLQKSWKSKLRFQQMDMETKKRQDSWLNFRKGKGAKKKVREAPSKRAWA